MLPIPRSYAIFSHACEWANVGHGMRIQTAALTNGLSWPKRIAATPTRPMPSKSQFKGRFTERMSAACIYYAAGFDAQGACLSQPRQLDSADTLAMVSKKFHDVLKGFAGQHHVLYSPASVVAFLNQNENVA